MAARGAATGARLRPHRLDDAPSSSPGPRVAATPPAGGMRLDPTIGLQGVVEALPVIAWCADAEGRFVTANGRWAEYRGLPDAVVSPAGADLGIHPDDRAKLLGRWRRSLRRGEPLEHAVRLLRHDGTYRWHLVRAVPFQAEGGRRLWIGTSTDIDDERREQEGRTLLLEAATRLDASLDADDTVAALTALLVPALADTCRVDLAGPRRAPSVREREAGQVAPARVEAPGERLLTVALRARGLELGRLRLTRPAEREPFSPADRAIVRDVARHAAMTLVNARLYAAERAERRRAQEAAVRTRRLYRLTRALSRARARTEVARLTTRHGRGALGAERAYLYVPTPDGTALDALAFAGYPAAVARDAARLPIEADRPLGLAFRGGEEQWIEDLSAQDQRFPDAFRPGASGTRAMTALPLVAEGRILGVLGFGWTVARPFHEDDRALARAIAGLAAQALDRLALLAAREALVDDLESQHERLVTVMRQLPGGVLLAEADGRVALANEEARRTLGLDSAAGSPDTLPAPLRRALASGDVVAGELLEVPTPEGAARSLLASAAPIRGRGGRIEAGVLTFADVTERRRAESNEQYLAAASTLLATSLDVSDALAQLASLAVPRVADWCTVELVDADGAFHQVSIVHPDPEKAEIARELRERYPIDPEGPVGAPAVVRTGQSQLVTEIPRELLDALPLESEAREVVERLGLRSMMCVPLRGRNRMLGAITFVGAESGRLFGADDLAFAERLADRAATAIDNAVLYREADRFRRMVEAEADVVLLFDAATLRVGYANRGAAQALGRAPSEIVGASAATLFRDVDEDRLRSLVTPILGGRTDTHTLVLALAGASGPTPVELLVQAVSLPGEPPSVLAIARDVSERVESQARLRRLAEAEHARAAELNAVIRAMGEGVLVCAADGRVTLANPAARELLGGAPLERYADVVARLDRPADAPRLGERGGPVELRAAGHDERWLELTTYPVGRLPTGSERETIVMLRDVTEARQRQLVRDTFVGVLSHELRTPVTTIFGGAKLLARGGSLSEAERQAVFADIHLEAERLHRLVEDVVALTRFGEEGGDIGSEPVLLQRILPGIVRAEETRWPAATFDVRVPTGLPTVVADPTYVEQVLRNLLSNAAKYGGSGVHVEVDVTATPEEVTVTILDDGPGFPPEEADRLFDLYFRSPHTSARVSGAGIGLFVCARLIRAMGGRVWARARAGRGAEFGFALRRMDENEA